MPTDTPTPEAAPEPEDGLLPGLVAVEAPVGVHTPMPGALARDDERFTRFQTAVLFQERVRVTYIDPVDDPLISNLHAIDTICEGIAEAIDEEWIHLRGPDRRDGDAPMVGIPRGGVKELVFLGPRPVDPADMV